VVCDAQSNNPKEEILLHLEPWNLGVERASIRPPNFAGKVVGV
jgi:hypothetical protein